MYEITEQDIAYHLTTAGWPVEQACAMAANMAQMQQVWDQLIAHAVPQIAVATQIPTDLLLGQRPYTFADVDAAQPQDTFDGPVAIGATEPDEKPKTAEEKLWDAVRAASGG